MKTLIFPGMAKGTLEECPVPVPTMQSRSVPWTNPTADNRTHSDGGLSAPGPVLHFAKDSEIYSEGDAADVLLKIVSGVVRTCRFFSDGRRQITAFHFPGEVFGFEAGPAHSLSAEAVSECIVVSYRWRGLEILAANNGVLARQILLYALRSLAQAQEHSRLLGHRSAAEKVATFLIDWAESMPDNKVVTLVMSRQDIADYLGLTVETVSRTLSQFKREVLIELSSSREIQLKNPMGLRTLTS